MTYQEYLAAAKQCADMSDAQQIINQAANDSNISDPQYENIRRVAIRAAYQY